MRSKAAGIFMSFYEFYRFDFSMLQYNSHIFPPSAGSRKPELEFLSTYSIDFIRRLLKISNFHVVPCHPLIRGKPEAGIFSSVGKQFVDYIFVNCFK